MIKLKFNEDNIKGPVAQPSNTITALAYLAVGFLLLGYDQVIAFAIFFVSITTIFFHSKDTLFGQYLDIFSIFVLIFILSYKAYPFTQLDRNSLFLGSLMFGTAFVFWVFDIKKSHLIPKNHILTGHGIWHILTATSVWFISMSLPGIIALNQ